MRFVAVEGTSIVFALDRETVAAWRLNRPLTDAEKGRVAGGWMPEFVGPAPRRSWREPHPLTRNPHGGHVRRAS